MEIELSRRIEVQKYKVILDIGIKQPRTDIIAVLKIASHYGNQINENIICNEFIFRNSTTIAQRILKRCQDFGVLDENNRLTEDGLNALSDERIYHPKTGVYHIWITQDPLIPKKLLNLELIDEQINFRNEFNAENPRRGRTDLNQSNPENSLEPSNIIDLPEWILEITRESNIILYDEIQREVRIESIEEKVESLSEYEELHVKVRINDSGCSITLDGLFHNTRTISEFPVFRIVWNELMGENIRNWNWDNFKFAKHFEGLNETEKKTFLTQIHFENPSITGYGAFDPISMQRIKVEPFNHDEAVIWANWLFKQDITKYLFIKTYNELKRSIQAKFPKFTIEFPTREDFRTDLEDLQEQKEIPDVFWYSNAPLDLIPINTSIEEEN
ncbi:hypothetical protein DSAG12_00312 [Promethearchaeum syntrophicum]|uniref:Uncharacterized protein n=1 Tax=Promethearchaeum syntrophicum TaxID=2594042 RepID=A0A5B9D5U8_9ARCH|nr:hypothetical protein [Candidatus Prometheoarchaeum syntrophicum]QEE14499.1 hypothetical protein DSAG12_00312 [Candidatus Prometheoarchaeum syntrophicum]